MDNDSGKTDYFDRVQGVVRAHPRDTAAVAISVVILVILAGYSSGFVELLKVVFSPQIVIGLIVVYFIKRFGKEISDLLPRVKEVKGGPIGFTFQDKQHIPDLGKGTLVSQDAEPPIMAKTCAEDLKEAQQKANYWFFRYLYASLTPGDVALLDHIAKAHEIRRDDLRAYATELHLFFQFNDATFQSALKSLSAYNLIRIENERVKVTDLGKELLAFSLAQVTAKT